jgi:uncharacterized protein
MEVSPTIVNRRELRNYLSRVDDRWPIEAARLGGAQVDDEQGAPPQRERGPEFVLVLVSSAYDGMPWLERVYQAGSLWDAYEMGHPADVHCYTPAEYERKRRSLRIVRDTAETGIDLLASDEPGNGSVVEPGNEPDVEPGNGPVVEPGNEPGDDG